jgi:hypothetical protein
MTAKVVPHPRRETGSPAFSTVEKGDYFFFRMGIPVFVVS